MKNTNKSFAKYCIPAICCALVALTGCEIHNDENVYRDEAAASSDNSSNSGSTTTSSSSSASDAVSFSSLNWCWGGFNGSNAAPVDSAKISGLKVSNSEISYNWVSGGCQALGAKSSTSIDCIIALFCQDSSGAWKGGKIDWISTSRTTRDTHNIKSGYCGWEWSTFCNSKRFALVITSRDGRKRTNVITCSR